MGGACSQPQTGDAQTPQHSGRGPVEVTSGSASPNTIASTMGHMAAGEKGGDTSSSPHLNNLSPIGSPMKSSAPSPPSHAPSSTMVPTVSVPAQSASPMGGTNGGAPSAGAPSSGAAPTSAGITTPAASSPHKPAAAAAVAPSAGPNANAPVIGAGDTTAITNDEQDRINALMTSPKLQAITPEVIKIIRETWALAMKRSDFAVAFYNDLLTKHRSMTEAIFYGVDIVLQAGRLVKMIEGAINLLGTPKSLVPVIIRLGSRHVAYGTTSQHFMLVTNSLVGLILETVGPAIVTPEVVGHWHLVLGMFEQIMESGYTTAAGKHVGKRHHSRIERTLLKCWKSTVAGHNKQLRQAGGSAPMPSVDLMFAAAAQQKNSGALHNAQSLASIPNNNVGGPSSAPYATQAQLFFGVPSTMTEAMLGRAMQTYIANGGDSEGAQRGAGISSDAAVNIDVSKSPVAGAGAYTNNSNININNNAAVGQANTTDISGAGLGLGIPMNHLLAPPLTGECIKSLASSHYGALDQLVARAFEVGLSHIEEDMPYFDKNRRDSSLAALPLPLPPKTLQDSEALYNSLQAAGKQLSGCGFRRGDLESLNDSFVKSTLFFASPEWNNPFVRDQMARFWMKFCSYIPIDA